MRRPDLLVDRTSQQAERVQDLRESLLASLAGLAAMPKAAPFRTEVAELRERLESIPRFEPTGAGDEVVHRLLPDMLVIALPGRSQGGPETMGGDEIDLAAAVRPLWAALEEATEGAARALATPDMDPDRIRDNLRTARGVVDKMHEHQIRMRDWQRRFSEYTGGAREEMESYFQYLRCDAIRRKAFLTLADRDPAGRPMDVTRALTQLTERLGRLSGVVWIENTSQTLDLSGMTIRGKLVLGVKGDVLLRDTILGGENDRLTVISHGRTTIEGSVRASLAALGPIEIGAAGCRLEGNLLLDRPRSGGLARLSIRHDPLVEAGRGRTGRTADLNLAYVIVGLAPRIACRQVERSRGWD